MESEVDDQCVNMEDNDPPPPKVTDEQHCSQSGCKASAEDFPPLSEPTVPDEPTPSMETDSITPDDDNEAKCAKLIDLRDFQLLHEARLRHHREIQQMILSGEISSPTKT
ncbi:hypothetical protein TNIN_136511 [Trichonephila inaurata madagascariensis]|uniref:Uncharacterized protein n=1 Tax=Trichonephila inaurata madagascariensis TaxID=2747483 RepID=A0A8X6YMJ9_9ARAC|nr:hypothetical protein TNIN_136511 [Trichonephila inaurata madagascariensis]